PGVAAALWRLVILSAFWLYHFDRAQVDRPQVGEAGASATLRRWYAYGIQVVALVVALIAVRDLLVALAQAGGGLGHSGLGELPARVLAWTALWFLHVHWSGQPE